MKSFYKVLVLLLLSAFAIGFAKLQAAPFAVFNHKVFYIPEKGPLIETYFDISAQSITLRKTEEGYFQGEVELTLIFKRAGEIVTFDKRVLKSPIMTADNLTDFIDVQRFAIPPGIYEVEIILRDVYAEENPQSNLTTSVKIDPAEKGAYFSDVQLVSAYKKSDKPGTLTKSGYDLIPMVSDSVLKTQMKELVFYAELYGMDKRVDDDMFLLSTYIKDVKTGEPVESTQRYERKRTAEVSPILTTIDISELPEGAYEITLEARDKENELLARQSHFVYRVKADVSDVYATTKDPGLTWVGAYDKKGLLYEHINSLRPIASDAELQVMNNSFLDVDKAELVYLQRFFYSFWESREPGRAEDAWNEYRAKVDFVEEEFGTLNKRGYETDQGRIYLKYGAPNHIADRANEPASYPYEIWQYYKTEQFNNVRFVFYDPTLLNNDYKLLHSEGVRGEIINPRWKYLLEKRSLPIQNIDEKDGIDHYGGRVDDYYNNPR